MKKIFYIITQSELGGAQKNVLDLASGLKDQYDILVATGPDGGVALNNKLFLERIATVRLKWLRRAVNPIFDFLSFWEIGRLILKFKPDIIHLHSSKAGLLGSLAARFFRPKTKIIYTSHGAAFAASFSKTNKKLFLWIEKFTAPLKNKIICVSPNEKKTWLEYRAAPETELTVINNGLDLKILPKILSPDEAREKLTSISPLFFNALKGKPVQTKIIGVIANFYPDKGLLYLIEAADTILRKTDPKVLFAVIGEGRERKLYEAMIKDRKIENNFILIGSVPDAIKYLKAFDVYVQPSLKEGFGYSVLEAMAAGLPIVASSVGGIPEMITNNANGFLLSPRDADGLAKKILELINYPSLAAKFSRVSQEKIKEFSLAKMIVATEKVYLEK